MSQDRIDIALALGVALGFGCAAGVVQSLGEGMDHYQIGRMLEALAENQGAMRAIASALQGADLGHLRSGAGTGNEAVSAAAIATEPRSRILALSFERAEERHQ